ncbi:MAG TPA: 2,3-diphosphoglycerate-dependent phosphoglycerate mutase [Candidatus Saccharimonadia bacterium]|nr:2,3-diphosphoglycerate-dependent phosphoglycerate mutase [Candidatus Saccharimonadia bacterium]
MPQLILARHGESEFNAKSLWTGIWDVPLTAKGRRDAALMAAVIHDLPIDVAFTSGLSRAQDTLAIILRDNHWIVPVHRSVALNERDYGQLTGLNKWEVEAKYGRPQFQRWRRGWNEPVPGGETLKDVSARAIPYYQEHIAPELQAGHNVLLVAHGNTLRALIKHLDLLSDEAVEQLEMPFGEIIVYDMSPDGRPTVKHVRQIASAAPPA